MSVQSNPALFEKYLSDREALIRDDTAMRRDHQPIRPISDTEKKADEKLRALRASEAQNLWKTAKDPSGKLLEMYPGMGFLTAKDIIHQSKIFSILQRMPKGALLHAHYDAICDFAPMLAKGLEVNRASGKSLLHVSVSAPVSSSNIHEVYPLFHVLDSRDPPSSLLSDPSASLTSSSYTPGAWVPIEVARQNFHLDNPETVNITSRKIQNKVMRDRLAGLTGANAFDTWAAACAALEPAEAHEVMNSVDEIWKRFLQCFAVLRGLTYWEPVYRFEIREILEHCVAEGISYIEIRPVFWFEYMNRANGNLDFDHSDWLTAFSEILVEFRADLEKRGEAHKFVGARIIYTSLRSCSDESLAWCLDDCIKMKKKFPELICGFDLVGQEDAGRPLLDFAQQLTAFQAEVKSQGLYIPFLFHAGETLGDGTSTDHNLYDAVLLGTKRIGHGFSVVKHPKLLDHCREGKVLIEVCPISNEILRLTSSMPTHPLPTMLNNGVPVALSSDDPAIFGSLGLAYDFYQVFVASEISGLTTLGTMAYDSILWAEMEPKDKERALKLWQQAWDEFVLKIAEDGF